MPICQRREATWARDENPTYIDNTKILLDLLRPWNRSVPTDNMTLIDTCLDCFSPVLYLAWVSLQKYQIPSSPKCSSVYENACFI